MALDQTWKNGVLIREDDTEARTVTTWDDDGSNEQARPYTDEENAALDEYEAMQEAQRQQVLYGTPERVRQDAANFAQYGGASEVLRQAVTDGFADVGLE